MYGALYNNTGHDVKGKTYSTPHKNDILTFEYLFYGSCTGLFCL